MEFPFSHNRHGNDHRPEEHRQPIYPPPGTTPPFSSHPTQYSSYPPPPQNFPHATHDFHHTHHHQQHHENPGFYPPPSVPEVHHIAHEIPPPSFYPPPSVPQVQHIAHEIPPPSFYPPPSVPQVQHIAHEAPPSHEPRHNHHLPSSIHHHHHGQDHHGGSSDYYPSRPSGPLPQGQDVRVFCQAETGYSLTIRDGSVILARSNPDDEFQHWIKDEKFSTRVKDQEGFPSFALVNKATSQVLQHSIGATQPVRLTAYQPDKLDQSTLWTLSKELGHGFRTIRMVNNIRLNLDAFNGDKNHGGVHDGTITVLWEWKKGDNQRWKLTPY